MIVKTIAKNAAKRSRKKFLRTAFPTAHKAKRIYNRYTKKIKEEVMSVVPVNSAGAGGIDGIGVGPNGEPGKKPLRKIIKRSVLKELQPKK